MDATTLMENKMKLAVFGAGHWGKNLIRNFYELGALDAIVEMDEERRQQFVEKYEGVTGYAQPDTVLQDDEYQAIVVATPAETHYQLAKAALLAGKDVYVEKPLALQVEDAQDLVRLAKENDRILMVGHLLLYHPAVVKMHEMIQHGDLGRIYQVYSNRLNLGKVRQE
ncbi:MAG TPA: Gfo/Idh/MocA family oxidoreductase, partial [Bacteroidales bacterium]|nr:Gfo/Idh/MocA family oxidoreductase [Bacteroidales bacterium]